MTAPDVVQAFRPAGVADLKVRTTSVLAVALTVGLAAQAPLSVPKFTVDPAWPRPLPNHWLGGAVGGVALDSHDHISITHRPSAADGYVNHRIMVFDATTGAYKRHWGAYGKKPDDAYFTSAGEVLPGPFSGAVQHENKPSQYDPKGPPPAQFRIVHAVRISKDGLVYVCDRTNDRLQVCRKDGTFVQEAFIAKETLGSGSVWDIGFSVDPQQQFAFVNDGTNQQVYVLDRKSLKVLSTFGGAGRWAGQFYGAHNLAVNSKGDLFITETYEGKRVQRFVQVGIRTRD